MHTNRCPPRQGAGGSTGNLAHRQRTAPRPAPQPPLTPERRARLLPAGCDPVPGSMAWWYPCPSCSHGSIPLLPDAGGRLVPSPIGCCQGAGWRCSSRRIREAWTAAIEGVELAPTEGEARLVGGLMVRRFGALWRGQRGRDPRAALWAVAAELDAIELPPRLIRLALEALAHRRRWPARLVWEVLR